MNRIEFKGNTEFKRGIAMSGTTVSEIDVYFNNGYIYSLEDLSILGELPKRNTMSLYDYFEIMKEEYNIRFAIMGFNHSLRNAIYSVFPNVSIIISPTDVIQMINSFIGCCEPDNVSEEEIAAGVGDSTLIIHETACQGIYYNHTKKEAINYYRQWQGDVPLGTQSFHNVIRTIDFYYEEVFNYFEFKNIFADKTLIR